MQVAGGNLIITGKPLALKIIDNPYTGQGFLHRVIGVFHRVSSVIVSRGFSLTRNVNLTGAIQGANFIICLKEISNY